MTGSPAGEPARTRTAVTAMLEARSVALVGASPRPGTLGQRMITEMSRSPAAPRVYLVNPRYPTIAGMPCHPSLAALPEPVDLVMLGVPDRALAEQVSLAARRGDRSAVIFGGAFDPPQGPPGLRAQIAATAAGAGMAVCGAGCMGFANVSYGLRALGYTEPERIEAGPVALVTHSGSVFSALLRARRRTGFTVAVSSGQELVTSAAAFARYALGLPGTRVLALVLEAMRDTGLLREVLAGARAAGIPVVLLTAGRSASGRAMVAAHSGALAGDDGAWEALAGAYGVHRVRDLAEMTDTLEVFAAGRKVHARPGSVAGPDGGAGADGAAGPDGGTGPGTGIATVHDSGLERAHFADLADELGVPYAPLSEPVRQRLAGVLGPGLEPANPLDMWDGSEGSQWQLAQSLAAFAADPAVAVVGLAVDLVPEFDGDRSYPLAVLDAAAGTSKPVVVITNIAAAVDQDAAWELRAAGIPVLEGARSGLLAVRHLLDHANHPGPGPTAVPPDPARQRRWAAALARGEVSGVSLLRLLREYGITAALARPAGTAAGALTAAGEIGYPVVLKTAEPGIAHKSEVGGVVLGITGPAALQHAYQGMAARLGPRVLVSETVPPGTELAVGLTLDPGLGPLLVVGAGGLLVEFLSDRAVALPPVSAGQARELLSGLRVSKLLAGVRGQPPADLGAVAATIAAVSTIARELGGHLTALDINPLICGPSGAIAVDALLLRHHHAPR